MKQKWSIVKGKVLKFSICVMLLSLLLGIVKCVVPSNSVNAGSGSWAIGGDGIIAPLDPSRHSGSGATAWTLGSTFLVHLQQLDTFAPKDGRDKMIEEVDSKVTRYMIDSIAIIPYELSKDLDAKNYNTVAVIKRPTADSTDVAYRSSKGYLNAVVKIDKNVTSKTKAFEKGVFYDAIKDKTNKELLDNWKELVEGKEDKCKDIWSYITSRDGDRYRVAERIDEYLHIKELEIDPNNMAKADPNTIKELKMRYTDLLMTLYTMIDGSYAQPAWETAIEEYIKGISDKKQNRSNICITPGVMARGIMTDRNGKSKTENIIAGVHDLLDMTIVTEPQYSLGALRTADTIEKSLEKKGKSLTYYNRLLESVRLSLIYQSKNNISVERTYNTAGLFGSNIVSRLIKNKPLIKGTTVSYQTTRVWSDQKLIENINLKKDYHGQIVVPAYTGVEEASFKPTLKVGSTKEDFEGLTKVDVKEDTALNDSPKLTINLDWQKDKEKWEMIFKSNKYFKVQVEFTRKPEDPSISLEPQSYINPPELISKDKLKTILQGEVELNNWLDKSVNKVPIEVNEAIDYTYQAKVIIYYSNKSRATGEMNKIEKETNKAKISYYKKLDFVSSIGEGNDNTVTIKNGFYISEPDAYAELKEGTVYNETFEAMAGVPTTRKLYFGSGGSEFMVEVEVQYDPDKAAERTYRSYFKGTDCEFKLGDAAPNMTLGEQSVTIHGGGTYSKTWTGSIPNTATAQTALHNATCTAIPDYNEYNTKKAEAQAFATQVNGTVLSFTSASDKKTRSYNDWKAGISADSQTLPQNTSASVPCEKKAAVTHQETIDNGDGTTSTKTVIDVPAVPCKNEMATANPGAAGSFTITVTWTVPAHVLCGPCCNHVLPSVEDTWTQKSTFDTLKIVDVRVWKIQNGYVEGMEDITYDEDAYVKASIKQGDPNIFYNIAGADTSQEGRLRYSLQQQQHDAVTWFERNSSGAETRSNKCNGLSGTLSSQNPIPVAPNRGHNNSWAKGLLYNNTAYPNKVDYHKTSSGTKSTTTNNSTDAIDKQTEEYKRFDERRYMDNTITVVSDMLILQTSSGDQSVLYFDTSQTKDSQENFDDIKVSFEQMWTNNGLSAANWKEDYINVGSYNGKFFNTSNKYEGTGNHSSIGTAFDLDAVKVSSGDEINKARVVSSKSFGSISGNKSSPSGGEARLIRPSRLRIFQDNIRQNPVNPNGEYFTGQSYVYYKEILSYTDDSNASGIANAHEDELEINAMGDFGYTIKSRYRLYDNKHGNINSIVVHNPVSVRDARIVSLPKEMDQRTTIPEGSADALLDEIAALEVCPLSPSLCEYRELNCQYYQESTKASFDFEKVNTLGILDDNVTTTEDITGGEVGNGQLVFDNFETNDYGINAINNCSLETSEERLVVNITGEDAEIELPVDINASSIVAVKVYYGTSGMSTSSKISWEGSNSSSITTKISPASINETMTFNLISSQDWKQADKISKIRFQFDGDNKANGMYIITKIEFLEEGDLELEDGIIIGSEDDKTIIRNLIKTPAGTFLDYSLPNGFSISEKEGTFNGFGTGRFLNVNGTRLSMGLDEIGLNYDEHTRVKVEANVYIPSIVSKDRMLFSFNGIGFYIPAGQTYGAFTTGSGVEKKVDYNFINKTLKLGVVFSFGDINDCEIYINDIKFTNVTTIKPSADITDYIIGDSVNIGCWNINQNYSTGFYLDNLKISKMPGTSEHTASCYTTYKEHHFRKFYTCDNSKYDFSYTGNVQTFTAPASGYYLLEAWGASGGGENSAGLGNPGEGGYSAGKVFLNKGEKLYVYVGEKGADSYSPNYLKGTFNGGGAGMDTGLLANGHQGGQGGGGTDFRKVGGAWDYLTGLLTRLLVAGGGGGAGCASVLEPGGDGGGLEGVTTWNTQPTYIGYQATGGTQTSGGFGMRNNVPLTGSNTRSGGFGYGAPGSQCGAGGGGGWYGGGSGYTAGGGGGSSYIDGVTDGVTLSGVHTGHGKAKITLLGHKHTSDCAFEVIENNDHIHTSECINENSSELVNALKLAEKGKYAYIKELLGDSVYNKLKAPNKTLYTWNNWTTTDIKQFRELNNVKFRVNSGDLIVDIKGYDPFFEVPVNLMASSIEKVRVYARLVGTTSSSSVLYFKNTDTTSYIESMKVEDSIKADNNWQWIEFDVSDNVNWNGNITSLRFDITNSNSGRIEIDQIQLLGQGSAYAGTATKVLQTYEGFTANTKQFGIKDIPGGGTTSFSGGYVVNTGHNTGWEFNLPVNIANPDALDYIRVTFINQSPATYISVRKGGDESNRADVSVTANSSTSQVAVLDVRHFTGAITSLDFNTCGGDVSGTVKVSKIELLGYGNRSIAPTETYTSGAYNAHIHTQDCRYTPPAPKYSPVALTNYHNTFNGGYFGSYTEYGTAHGSAQRLYAGTYEVNMTSAIGPNRYVEIQLRAGNLTRLQTYSQFNVQINGTWMSINTAVKNGYLTDASSVTLYDDSYYTPHPYPQNILSGNTTGQCEWQGIRVTLYTTDKGTIQDIRLWTATNSKPGDGILIRSGSLTSGDSGTWNCGNSPLNTYTDLVGTVTPVKRGTESGSETFIYNGGIQTFTAPSSGKYTLEVWGAQGGQGERYVGGKGGYSKGDVSLSANQTIYVVVGGAGLAYSRNLGSGGYNGGGAISSSSRTSNDRGTGGGATHIAKRTGLLSTLSSYKNDILIVAGAGGGSGTWEAGGAGGGLDGLRGDGTIGTEYSFAYGGGGNQSTGGKFSRLGSTINMGSDGSFGQGGHSAGSGSSYAPGGGGGGGYYGGGGGNSGSPASSGGGGGGSSYVGGVTNSTTEAGVNSGNGKATISWGGDVYYTGPNYVAPPNRYNYNVIPATIAYVAPTPVKSNAAYGFGNLNGTEAGILATIDTISTYFSEVPQTINGVLNPIFICNNKPNIHKCTDKCREITILTCNEPHHYGQHYDYDNDICWDPCGDDNNHKHSVKTPVTDADGNIVHNGTFINLDNYFQVYFPNIGDFGGTNEYGIASTTINRGKGYFDNMSTLEWTREKKVMFGFDVLLKNNGVWEQHQAGEWISLPVKNSAGQELIYYDFYCLLSNKEQIATNVEFLVEAINGRPSPGGKENPYLGDDFVNADCVYDIYDGNVTNKDRSLSFEAYHSAYRMTYTDIVGRIGNLIMEDTEDLRFSNLFKESTLEDKWIVEGILHEVNTGISNHYLSWFNNDGSFAKDIRGVTVSKETEMYNTYGTQEWTNKATALPIPLEAARNVVPTLRTEQLKPGYNILFDISTIGEYRHKLQVIPYFYALNTDTNTLTPIDVYIKIDGGYEPINFFGLMSEYVQANNTYSDEYYTMKDKLYPYIMNLNWTKEALRRNYSNEEETITKYMGLNAWESVKDASGNVLTTKYLTIPFGESYTLGTIQMLVPGARARTFIGSSKVNSVNINGSTETNINGTEPGISFINNAQRWHLKLGIPSSVVYVPYRNGEHIEPTADVILPNGSYGKAYEEIENGNYVILMTADIKAIGNTFVLGYDQGVNNGKITVNGKTYTFGNDIPTLIAIYDAKKNSSFDIDFIGTH